MTVWKGKKAAILIADRFQDEEGVETTEFLGENGMETVYVGLATGTVQGKNGRQEVEVQAAVKESDPADFDLLVIPGGGAPEILRRDADVLAFTRAFFEAGKPVAAICHGPQVLISAGVLPGRLMTSYPGIGDDVRLAGAIHVDEPVVVDGNLITSRNPGDIPAMNQAILEWFEREPGMIGVGRKAEAEAEAES